MINDIQAPRIEAVSRDTPAQIKSLCAASVNALAYDLVTKVNLDLICDAYEITKAQLLCEIKDNIHLKQAIAEKKKTIELQGSFGAAVEAVASETLPLILKDNLDEDTDPSTRSRNMQMLMGYKTQQDKIRADLEKADKGNTAMMGVQVNFQVSPGIRGISAPVIEQE